MSAEGGEDRRHADPDHDDDGRGANRRSRSLRKRKAGDNDSKSAASGGVGGLLGGFAKKMAQKKAGGDDANKERATVMTMTNEVLKVVTDVPAAEVAVPAGFKESR